MWTRVSITKKKLFLLILDFMTSERDNIDILCEQEKRVIKSY